MCPTTWKNVGRGCLTTRCQSAIWESVFNLDRIIKRYHRWLQPANPAVDIVGDKRLENGKQSWPVSKNTKGQTHRPPLGFSLFFDPLQRLAACSSSHRGCHRCHWSTVDSCHRAALRYDDGQWSEILAKCVE